ncbi:hypothetical protein OJF2_77030 [Aquisphaera giovannonii]|uniref:Uncharacterized protein n=1 Tax=Aquisphaera giovannonii TaxID=406548 RepID=A0A5B9WGF3_9BACT|nr:hypothetical protein [Aquisphaera giovannonii]QEH39091.1 hypothetical protein OJF2_77030 [Aquisphaera giovannonii]
MRVEDFQAELGRWEARHREWAEPINQFLRASLPRINKDGYTPADFQRELHAIRERRRAEDDPGPEVESILGRMCEEYLGATPAERERCRAAVVDKQAVRNALLGYVASCADRIRGPDDLGPLRPGLEAASIEDCARDDRDALVALAGLHVRAERAGIDPSPHFREVARLSSHASPRGGDTPVSEMLREFPHCAVLAECRASQGPWPPAVAGTGRAIPRPDDRGGSPGAP